jgi:hypothetical protein
MTCVEALLEHKITVHKKRVNEVPSIKGDLYIPCPQGQGGRTTPCAAPTIVASMIEGRVLNQLKMEVDQIRAKLDGEGVKIQAATFYLPLEVETWAIKHARVLCLNGQG